MSTSSSEEVPDLRELQALLLAREEGTLDDAGQDQLERLVLEHPLLAEMFVESLLQTVSLRAWAEAASPCPADEGKREPGPHDPAGISADSAINAGDPAARAVSPLLGFLDKLPVAIQPASHPVRFFSVAVLMTTFFWVAVTLFIWPRGGAEHGAGTGLVGQMSFTARLLNAREVAWAEGQRPLPVGSNLVAEQTVELERGQLDLLFGSGARVAVEGPARIRIVDRGRMALGGGRLLARVDNAARGFTVDTPAVRVVDLGTEFGLDVQAEETEVQVFEGKVDVWRAGGAGNRLRMLSAHEAAMFGNSPQQGFYVKEKEMNRTIYLSLAAVLTLASPAAAAMIVEVPVADYRDDYQTISPAAGWSYLYNANGAIGTESNYVPLVWNSNAGFNFYTHSSSITEVPTSGTGQYVRLTATGGHPGPGSPGQGGAGGIDRYAIAAYTIGETGDYLLTDTLLSRGAGTGGTNAIALRIYVNNLLKSSTTVGASSSIVFNQSLGELQAGDKLFVAIGPDGNHGSDSFQLDFTLSQLVEVVPPPAPEPASGAILGVGGMLVLGLTRRRRRK